MDEHNYSLSAVLSVSFGSFINEHNVENFFQVFDSSFVYHEDVN